MSFKYNGTVLETAAKWHARLSAPDCTQEDRTLCEAWKQQHPANEKAYAAAEQLSQVLGGAAAANPELQVLASRAFAAGRADSAVRQRRRWLVPAALAAGLALTFGAYRLGSQLLHPPTETAYVTAAGEHRDITLADGSVIHLDVSSDIKVSLGPGQRRVNLLAGRAYFEVAHDAARPFMVFAGGQRITDIGTRFQVERQDQFVLVTLTEGSVSVSADKGDQPSPSQVLQAGEQIRIKLADGSWVRRSVDMQVATSWSHGRLVFRSTPLSDALEEVNRYAAKKVRLGDPSLGSLPVSGNFIAGDSALVVSAFSALLPLRAVDMGGEIVLFRSEASESASQSG